MEWNILMDFKKWLIDFKDKIRFHFHEISMPHTSEHSIGLGFSIGTFISILPLPFINILLAILAMLIIRQLNKFALLGAMVFWNALTLSPFVFLSYKIGSLFFKDHQTIKFSIPILNTAYNFALHYLIGNMILAIVTSICSYFIIIRIVRYYRKRKPQQKLLVFKSK
jgi:uncharacterized protein (DUF2062 family)